MTRGRIASSAPIDVRIVSAGAGAVTIEETALYPHLKAFLSSQGFEVKREICGHNVVAVRDGEPALIVITELRLSLTLEMVLQAVDRLRAGGQIYLAVAGSRRGRHQDSRVHRLCRLVGVGLLAVDASRGTVSVVVEPLLHLSRANPRPRRRIPKSHAKWPNDPTSGGSTRQPIMTAYRQRAIACAEALQARPLRPRDLKSLADDAGAILRHNLYDWFERVKAGVYRLSPTGLSALVSRIGPEVGHVSVADQPISDIEASAASVALGATQAADDRSATLQRCYQLTLIETAPGNTVEEVVKKIGASLAIEVQ